MVEFYDVRTQAHFNFFTFPSSMQRFFPIEYLYWRAAVHSSSTGSGAAGAAAARVGVNVVLKAWWKKYFPAFEHVPTCARTERQWHAHGK